MQTLNFGMADIYPNLGYMSTRSLTVPEASDQNTLVDDQDLAEKAQVQQDPSMTRNILISIGVFIAVIALFSWK